ncbi:GNAT family N-acetyltransferase [Rufibacter roseus]|uniref:GNAT family N-acetyltransferase n=1 Tax=Rufibacter roseus TaxID=1567108 RepID=A0ABW2DUA4_9BACT|nr:GNAT family N-acetyltransferase [Rufibacter roseus]
MFVIETPRLKILPLTAEQLKLYSLNNGSLEAALGTEYQLRDISFDLKHTLENYFLPLVSTHSDQYYFYTLWTMVLKEQNQLVGDLCFKGPPTEEGQVEIGYGTYPEHQGKGLMTEAIAALLQWCKTNPNINLVLAQTETDNLASEKILQKNNFRRYHQGQDDSWWEIKVDS